MSLFLVMIFLLNASAQDATLVDGTSVVESTQSENALGAAPACTNNHNLDTLSNNEIIAAQCTPMAMAFGLSAARTLAPAAVSRVAAKAASGMVGRVGAKIVFGLSIIGVSITTIEIMKVLGALTDQARQCQLHEHDLKRSVYDETDERGRLLQESLEEAGFKLTDQQKRQLYVPAPQREEERLQRTSCGDVNLFAVQMEERQNRVYLALTTGTTKNVPFPEVPKRMVTDGEEALISDLYGNLECMTKKDAIRTICAIGNLTLLGKSISSEIQGLRKVGSMTVARVPSVEEIKNMRMGFFKTQLASNLRFPQTDRGIAVGMVSHIMKSDDDIIHIARKASKDEMEKAIQSANNAHKARGIPVTINSTQAAAVLDGGSLMALSRTGQVFRVLTEVQKNATKPLLTAVDSRFSSGDFVSRNYKTMATRLDTFRLAQSDEGRDYLKAVGGTLDKAMWSDEMKVLSRQWQQSYQRQTNAVRLTGSEFGNRFNSIIERHLLENHPELRAPMDYETLMKMFPERTVTIIEADKISAAGWIARLFSLVYQ